MRVFYTELASYCVLLTVRIISSLCGSNCQIHSCFLSLSGRNGSFSSPYLSNHTYLRWHQVNIKRESWIQTSLTISKLKHFFDTTAVSLIWFEPYSVIATGGVQRWAPTGHLSPEQCFGGGDLADPIWAAFNQPNSAGDVERQGALCCAVPCRAGVQSVHQRILSAKHVLKVMFSLLGCTPQFSRWRGHSPDMQYGKASPSSSDLFQS